MFICIPLGSLFLWECHFRFTPFLFTPAFSEAQIGRTTMAGCDQDCVTIERFSVSGDSTESRSNGRAPQLVCLQSPPAIMQLA